MTDDQARSGGFEPWPTNWPVTDDQAVPPPADAIESARGQVADTAIALQNTMESITAGPRERQLAFAAYADAWHALAEAIAAQAAAAERDDIRAELAEYTEGVAADMGGSSAAFAVLREFASLLKGRTDGH